MNQSSQVFALLGMAVAGAGLLAGSVAQRAPRRVTKAASQNQPWTVDLSGPTPLSLEFLKKPVPIFSVCQY